MGFTPGATALLRHSKSGPERRTPTQEDAEEHLARMASALPLGGRDLMQLVGLLTSRPGAGDVGVEAQLHRAEAQYRALVEQIPAVTFMAPLDGSTSELYVSPQIEELLGFSAQEWLEDPFLWYRQLHPDDQVRWTESFATTCFSGERFRAEFRFLARDGRVVWVHGEAKLVMDENGVPSFLHGVAFDITERKRAEEATRAAYEEIRRLTDQLRADNVYLQEEIKLKCNFGEIVGQTPAIRTGTAPGRASCGDVGHCALGGRDRDGQGTCWRGRFTAEARGGGGRCSRSMVPRFQPR